MIIRTEESKKVLSQWGGLTLAKSAIESLGLSRGCCAAPAAQGI
jgi:hypothetical protein